MTKIAQNPVPAKAFYATFHGLAGVITKPADHVLFLEHESGAVVTVTEADYPALTVLGEVASSMQQLSSSRLNHRLPGCETHPEVMQGTTEFHHEIADAVLPQPDPVFDDAAALDAAVHMHDPQPTVVQGLIGQLLFQGKFWAAGFLRRHEELD